METHSRKMYSPLCGISAPYSAAVARYAALIWNISPTNYETHLAESGFQTPSSGLDRCSNTGSNVCKIIANPIKQAATIFPGVLVNANASTSH